MKFFRDSRGGKHSRDVTRRVRALGASLEVPEWHNEKSKKQCHQIICESSIFHRTSVRHPENRPRIVNFPRCISPILTFCRHSEFLTYLSCPFDCVPEKLSLDNLPANQSLTRVKEEISFALSTSVDRTTLAPPLQLKRGGRARDCLHPPPR